MKNLKFATFRLGKTSVQDIQRLDGFPLGIVHDNFAFVVTCTQVPDELSPKTIVFIWLGSDNSKGIPTSWKQGFRGVGIVSTIERGENYNDESHTTIDLKYIFNGTVNRVDFLRECPNAYFWCSTLPIIGLDDHSNQTVRILNETDDRSHIGAFLLSINSVCPTFKKDIAHVIPGIEEYFWTVAPNPKTEHILSPLVSVSIARPSYQLITYGAPGTGKSHQTYDEVAGHTVFRTTFHPDSDYSTFVGAYKPTMTDDAGETEIWKLTKDGAVQDAVHKVKRGISYSFVAQAFIHAYVAAWKKMGTMDGPQEVEPVFLVIEEINRGNCAQIFGDLFQLLDRNDAGYSEYPIEADADLKRYLGAPEVLGSLDPKKMARHGVPEDIASGVVSGEKLVLPPNFYIRATMNTSDQSLFPMDSAFKRRWDWKYVPIKNAGEGWKIKVDDFERNWWDFLVAINKIVKGVTNSSDKQMGYFFVHAKNKEINADMFVNKVAFYLWNDVFKDCELDGEAFKIEREGGEVDVLAFPDFFREDGTVNEDVLKDFLTKLMPPENAAPKEVL